MRMRFLLHSCYCIAILGYALCGRPSAVDAQQLLPMDPQGPLAPTEYSQCNAYSEAWDRLDSEIERQHKNCLDANEKNKTQRNPENGSGVGSRCTYDSCQALHTRMFEIQSRKGPAVESCRAQVKRHKEDEQRQREMEEKRRREAEDKAARERAEEEKRQTAKREQQEADKKKRDNEADAARKREEANRKLIQMAAEQQRLEQEALARRTAERERQMEELKKSEGQVEDRFQQNVEKQTREAQDDLLAQMRKNVGPENSVFPPPDSNKTGGEEFDLSSVSAISDGTDPAVSLPQLDSEYEDAIAPRRDSAFSTAFQTVRDFVSPILKEGRAELIAAFRERTQEQLDDVKDTIIAGVFNDAEGVQAAESMVKKFYDDTYKDPIREMSRSAFERTVGGLLKETAGDISKSIGARWGGEHAELVGALTDVAVKHGAEKLSDYVRGTFVDSMSVKASEAYRNLSEKLIGPTDPVTQPVEDTAVLRLPGLLSKMGNPVAAAKAIYDYGTHMVNAMGEMFDRLVKSDFFGTAPPDPEPNK